MSYTFLAEQGAESSAERFSDIPAYVLSSLNLTAEKSCCNDNETESCHASQFGMTLQRSTESRGADLLTSSPVASLAKTSAVPEKVQASLAQDRVCGKKWHELSVKYNRVTHGWKTAQCLWEEDLKPSSLILPRWGSLHDGELWERATPGLHTSDIASGFWPTPRASEAGPDFAKLSRSKTGFSLPTAAAMWPTPRAGNPGSRPNGKGGKILNEEVTKSIKIKIWPTPCSTDYKGSGVNCTPFDRLDFAVERGRTKTKIYSEPVHGQLNPAWVEWLMGWPIGWTSLEPIKMDWRDWSVDPADSGDVPRVTTVKKDRAKRLKAIGNGQVPAVVKLAWEALI